jgi:Enoyl-CoA hydratase/isomerase
MLTNRLAGADIKEMKDKDGIENYKNNFLGHWTHITNIRKPIIAAVNGFAVSLRLRDRLQRADNSPTSLAEDANWP